MNCYYDLKRYAVLYVDDEEMALKYFEKTFGKEFRILTANNAADGLKLIETYGDEIGILLSDQRMPGEKGVQLLERARQLRPRMVRMLITAFADFGVTVDAVNVGNVFRYISKPLQVEDMNNTLRRAMEFYYLQLERDELLKEKLSALQNILITDRVTSLGVLAAGLNRQFRNSLVAVQKFLELTPGRLNQQSVDLEKMRDPSFWRQFHGLVVSQSKRIAAMVADMNGGASPSPVVDQPIDTAAVINDVVQQYQSAFSHSGIHLQLNVTGKLPVLNAEPRKFQKLVSLLLKSKLAIPSSGTAVSMTVSATLGNELAPNIQIAFSDNGPALPAEALRSVFDPFFIRVDGGEDLGLNLIGLYLLVYHHGGNVSALKPGESGLNIIITIPATCPVSPSLESSSSDFVTNVLMNDTLWERLLPNVQ
jgi:two-component system, probable response regulator PhcQ